MSTNPDYNTTMRALSEFLREVDDDPRLAQRLQDSPEETLRETGVDEVFNDTAFTALVEQLRTLRGEAWLATVHSMMELAEIGARTEPPTGPNVFFRLADDRGVTAVANRGEIAKKVGENPFYGEEGAARPAARPERSSVKVLLRPDFGMSDLAHRLGERYLSSFYQRTLIKRVVLEPDTVVEDASVSDSVVVHRSEFRGVRFEVQTSIDGDTREIIAAYPL